MAASPACRCRSCWVVSATARCQPENLEGQARVAQGISVPLAIGEGLRKVYEYQTRFAAYAMGIIQPELPIKLSTICRACRESNRLP